MDRISLLTQKNPEQLFVAQLLIKKNIKSKYCISIVYLVASYIDK